MANRLAKIYLKILCVGKCGDMGTLQLSHPSLMGKELVQALWERDKHLVKSKMYILY